MKSKIIIASDGEANGTRIYAGACDITGFCTAVRWSQEGGRLPEVHLQFAGPALSMLGTLATMQDGAARQITRIIFSDGTELSTED